MRPQRKTLPIRSDDEISRIRYKWFYRNDNYKGLRMTPGAYDDVSRSFLKAVDKLPYYDYPVDEQDPFDVLIYVALHYGGTNTPYKDEIVVPKIYVDLNDVYLSAAKREKYLLKMFTIRSIMKAHKAFPYYDNDLLFKTIVKMDKQTIKFDMPVGAKSFDSRITDAVNQLNRVKKSGSQFNDNEIQQLERVGAFIDWKLEKLYQAEARLT